MSIPLATTTITVMGVRPQTVLDPDAAGYDVRPEHPATVLATAVRASITEPKSQRGFVDAQSSGNADEIDEYALRCDIFTAGLTRFDTVIDEKTGVSYEVRVSALSPTDLFGLQHIKALVRRSEGVRDVPTVA